MSRKLLVTLVVALVGVATVSCGRSVDVATPDRTLPPGTKPPAAGSVAGQPCVAASPDNPKAEGKPEVSVPVGPPPTELVKTDLKVGDGQEVVATDTITVQYVGISCSTGKQFDSSWDKGTPATFPLSGVIPGWTQGIPGMKVGGQRQLVIPPALAYGDNPTSPDIAPGETLIFVIDLISIGPADTGSTVPGDPGTTAATTAATTPGSTP